jgi:hypothetical protein
MCWLISLSQVKLERFHWKIYEVHIENHIAGLWAFLFFVAFCYMCNQWSKAAEVDYGSSNINAAIIFSFFSIFTWAGCAYFAYLRFKAGEFSAAHTRNPKIQNRLISRC